MAAVDRKFDVTDGRKAGSISKPGIQMSIREERNEAYFFLRNFHSSQHWKVSLIVCGAIANFHEIT
jgi:hypothetical protein